MSAERWVRSHSHFVYSLAQLQWITSLDTHVHYFSIEDHISILRYWAFFIPLPLLPLTIACPKSTLNCFSVQMQISYKSSLTKLIRIRHRGMAWCCFLNDHCMPCFHNSLSMLAYVTNRFQHISCTMCSTVPWRQFTLLQPTVDGCSTLSKVIDWLVNFAAD